MKYIKKYEKLVEELEIGDYVKLDEDTWKWINIGMYGRINQKIFKIIEIEEGNENTRGSEFKYLVDLGDWFRRDQLEKASDIEIAQMKYNL